MWVSTHLGKVRHTTEQPRGRESLECGPHRGLKGLNGTFDIFEALLVLGGERWAQEISQYKDIGLLLGHKYERCARGRMEFHLRR